MSQLRVHSRKQEGPRNVSRLQASEGILRASGKKLLRRIKGSYSRKKLSLHIKRLPLPFEALHSGDIRDGIPGNC